MSIDVLRCPNCAAPLPPGARGEVVCEYCRHVLTNVPSPTGYRWVAGDVLDAISKPELEDVVVLNFDGYGSVGDDTVLPTARVIRALAKRAIQRCGAFALFWNSDLDAPRRLRERCSVALRRHVELLVRGFSGVPAANRILSPGTLLPGDADAAIDGGATGIVGAFDVYRGAKHRMACLRLVLR